MRRVTGTILEVGIDWITAVGFAAETQESMQSKAASWIHEEGARGNDCQPWRFAGYEGFKCGSVQVGTRPDSTCIRLSSALANTHWESLYLTAESITRVDLQVTIRTELEAAKALRVVHRQALAHSKKSKNGPTVTVILGSDGSGTVYLGKRTSDYYGRCYLKGAESKLVQYDGTLRFEVEVKGSACHPTLRGVIQHKPQIVGIASVVSTFFSKRGVNLEIPSASRVLLYSSSNLTDDARRLKWLSTQVRPSVQTLINRGCYAQVLEALGLSDASESSGEAVA